MYYYVLTLSQLRDFAATGQERIGCPSSQLMAPRTFRWVDLAIRDPQLPEALPKADRWAHGFAHAYTRHHCQKDTRGKLVLSGFCGGSTIFWMIDDWLK